MTLILAHGMDILPLAVTAGAMSVLAVIAWLDL